MNFWNKYKVLITFVITSVIFLFIIKSCEKQPKIVTETKYDISKIIDSVKQATLKNVKTVYIDTSKTKIKWLKGETKIIKKDSIVYVDVPNNKTITAKQYETELKSNEALANLSITTTGELLDVKGIITYPEKIITNTVTKTYDNSGAFFYFEGQLKKKPERFELGLDYQIKNKLLLGFSLDYNNLTKNISGNFKIGVSVF